MISEKEQATQDSNKTTLDNLNFVNTAFNSLRIDENIENKTRSVRGYNYSKVKPSPLENPRYVSLSKPALELLDLDYDQVKNDKDGPEYLSGNKPIPGSQPIAHNYCGHQFGVFAGQLGDGRAITLGDIKNKKGELWELQFKGSGMTPYSRFADGKAVLRSSIREYLCSEAMWALGIPTTRAASLIVTDSLAERDPHYNGNKILEKCSVVLRLAPTFWRFGSFEIFKPSDGYSGKAGPSNGMEGEMLPEMLDHVLNNYYPEIKLMGEKDGLTKEQMYIEMYREITRRTAQMVALWQCYGFCHGVLNTDNMSVLGLTIDYGPFGWMDHMDKNHICNTSDEQGRYSYKNQPLMCKWNLMKLAQSIQSIIDYTKTGPILDKEYDSYVEQYYMAKMREKLGLIAVQDSGDKKLIEELFEVMDNNASDFTNTFRALIKVDIPENDEKIAVSEEFIDELLKLSPSKEHTIARHKPRYSEDQIIKLKMMLDQNPHVVMMMGINPDVIEKEEEKLQFYKEFMKKDEDGMIKERRERWESWLARFQKRLYLETLATKGTNAKIDVEKQEIVREFGSVDDLKAARKEKMESVNPIYVLRNYMAEEAIRKAEKGDYSGVENLLKMLMNPFKQHEELQESKEYKKCPPKWSADICVSCSS